MCLLWTLYYRFYGFLWCQVFHLLSIPFWKSPVKHLSSVLWIWIFSHTEESWVWKCKGPFAFRTLVGWCQYLSYQAAVLALPDISRRIGVKRFSCCGTGTSQSYSWLHCWERFFAEGYLDLCRQRIGDFQAPAGCQCRGPWISIC